jgi:choline dehydrogenase-like flavoprotein
MMETVDSATGRGTLGLSWYVKTEVRPENRIVFSGTETDILGMPAMTFEYSLSAADRDLLEQGRRSLARAAEAVGEFDPATIESLPLGGSLHYTGTVRIGPVDDGTSVADADGRVWGTGSVFVAGNGAVPTALTCNSTLTAAVLAVRTARAVAAQLANGGVPTRSSVPTVPTHP